MKLGILVNTDQHLEHIVKIARAATANAHEVIIFAMDEGTRLLENELFVGLATVKGVSMGVCEHSAKVYSINTVHLPKDITFGSQFNNAMMAHEADRVIVL